MELAVICNFKKHVSCVKWEPVCTLIPTVIWVSGLLAWIFLQETMWLARTSIIIFLEIYAIQNIGIKVWLFDFSH